MQDEHLKISEKVVNMAPKMTQHGAQLDPFGGSFGSKKSLKNETQKRLKKESPGSAENRLGAP